MGLRPGLSKHAPLGLVFIGSPGVQPGVLGHAQAAEKGRTKMRNRRLLIMAFLLLPFFAASGRAGAAVGQWTLIGPQPLIYTNGTHHSGQVNALAVDPRNPSVVYLGAAGGGVWKSTDGGQTWVPLTDNQPSLEIGALTLDPSNPDIVYAGTDMKRQSVLRQ